MGRHSLLPFVFGPLFLFVFAMVGMASFVTHPPLLGWIGLAVLTAAFLAAGSMFATVFSRMRTNAPRHHPLEGYVHRLLVVLDADVEPEELTRAVSLRSLERHTEVRLVAPVMPSSSLHYLTDNEDQERREARDRLNDALRWLADAGVHAQAVLGTDDPLLAVGDALTRFHADESCLLRRFRPGEPGSTGMPKRRPETYSVSRRLR